jgi:type I restriction enzyme, S subunit
MKKLPPGWVQTSIGAIADLINGRAFKPSDWGTKGLPIVRIQNLNRQDTPFNHFSGDVDERHLIRDGDLLFAWSGTPGTSFGAHIWRGPEAVLNQHIFHVRVDSEAINREFLRAAINHTLDQQIAKAHGGAGLQHVTKAAFEATPIVLPPLAEQNRIVERLNAYEQRIAAIRSSLNEGAAAVEKGRSALLAAAYDLTLLPYRRTYSSTDKAPFVSVGGIALNIAYGSSAKSAPTGEVAVLRMGNIRRGELDWTDLVFTSDEKEIDRYLLEPGDVLFNRTNGSPQLVGKTAVYHGERPAIHAGYLIRIRCDERVVPDYLGYCLNSPAGREYCIAVRSDSAGQSNINAKKLAAFQFRCPSLDEQQAIVDLVRAGMRRLAIGEAAVAQAFQMLERLNDRMLDEALTGRLGTKNSSDEPASVQLDRLVATKQKPKIRTQTRRVGAKTMKRTVLEILQEAKAPVSAQQVAELYGIKEGASPEEVEPFYAELRALDQEGRLVAEPFKDADGVKLGDHLLLKAAS